MSTVQFRRGPSPLQIKYDSGPSCPRLCWYVYCAELGGWQMLTNEVERELKSRFGMRIAHDHD